MSPKTKFTQEEILTVAYEIAKKEGLSAISARKIANQLGCSVAPIYVNFKSIDHLIDDVVKKVFALTQTYISEAKGLTPFEQLGYASFQFAKEYPILFRELALIPNRHMSNYDDVEATLLDSFQHDESLSSLSQSKQRKLLLQMRIFHLGLSTMIANDFIPSWLTIKEAENLIIQTGRLLIKTLKEENNENT